jgi:hypothetical protein
LRSYSLKLPKNIFSDTIAVISGTIKKKFGMMLITPSSYHK